MKLITCTLDEHGEKILAIFNDAILHTTSLYEDKPRDGAVIKEWFATKERLRLPVLGAVDEDGAFLGFSSYGPFRPQMGYRMTVEHSVYVDRAFRGKGIGKFLLQAIVQKGQEAGLHAMVGVIDADNQVSRRLHASLGFEQSAHLKQVGFKFGRWLDVVIYQKLFEGSGFPGPS